MTQDDDKLLKNPPRFTEDHLRYLELQFPPPYPRIDEKTRKLMFRAGSWKVIEHIRALIEAAKQQE